MYVAIMKTDGDLIAKYAEFETEQEAQAHVGAFAEKFPDAFVVPLPDGPVSRWRVSGQAVTVVPEPGPSTDPADYPLYPAQFKALVDYLGKDSAIRLAIANIPDALQRSWALSRYLNAKSYLWTDAFLQQMRAAVGMTEKELSEAWMLAKDLKSE